MKHRVTLHILGEVATPTVLADKIAELGVKLQGGAALYGLGADGPIQIMVHVESLGAELEEVAT